MTDVFVYADGVAICQGRRLRCAVGRSGLVFDKHEGDGGTPIGYFPLRRVFYRPDKGSAPVTRLPVQAIQPDDGWCDAPEHPQYNTLVKRPFAASHEALWRDDDVYNLIIEVGYNDAPIIAGRGSAIFMHLAKPDFAPTEGCVAFMRADLEFILSVLRVGSQLVTAAQAAPRI